MIWVDWLENIPTTLTLYKKNALEDAISKELYSLYGRNEFTPFLQRADDDTTIPKLVHVFRLYEMEIML